MSEITENGKDRTEDGQKDEDIIRQYISFTVGKETYAVEITTVREIKGWIPTTNLPNSPDHMRGVLNLRGLIVPVFDLRARFNKGLTDPGKTHVVIIVTIGEKIVGVLVDTVSDILTIKASEIRPVPDADKNPEYFFIAGLVPVEEMMVALLNLERLFDMNEVPEMDADAA